MTVPLTTDQSIDVSPERIAASLVALDKVFMETQDESPEEAALIEAMDLIETLRDALTNAQNRIAELSNPCWREDDVEHPCGRTCP